MTELKTCTSRRDFLKGITSLSALSLLYLTGGCESIIDAINHRPVRRDISGLSPSDPVIQAYQAAISAMKALPSTDPRNWTRQAQIHLNHCPHRNWYLLPWHRAYLVYFEKICRKLSGHQEFALPYWNWTANPIIPAMFWGSGNPLFDSNRTATATDVLDPSFVGAAAMNNILDQTNFFIFGSGSVTGQRDPDTSGLLESTPHNYVHNFVGGDMATFMSPLDPIFWTHHAMIDCCWVEWNLNRNHDNPNDTQWVNFSFPDFVDENGNPVNVAVLETILYPIFTYRYEPCQPAQAGAPMGIANRKLTSRAEARALEAFARKGAPVKWDFSHRFELQKQVAVEIGRAANQTIRIDPGPVRDAIQSGQNRMLLTIGEVEFPQRNDFFIRVFVNKPDASAATSTDDPHYAGSFAMFFDDREDPMQHGKAAFLVDVTDTLRRLNQSGTLTNLQQAGIQLVAAPFPHHELRPQKLTIGRVELGAMPVKQ